MIASPNDSSARGLRYITATLAVAILFLGGSAPIGEPVTAHAAATTGPGAVALLLPNRSDPRWSQDAAYFVWRLTHDMPNVRWVVLNADGSESNQIQQAQTALKYGVKVLVVAPVNQAGAARIVASAHAKSAQVIAYDAPIESPRLDLYVGFNPVTVGMLQGSYIAANVPRGGRLVFINGPADDDIALAQYQGYYGRELKVAVSAGRFTNEGSYFPPGWSSAVAKKDMIDALFRNHDQVQGVIAANDTLAAGVRAALAQVRFNHPLPLTGSDASVQGIRALIRGTQSMDVYKPVYREANTAADSAVAYLTHAHLPTQDHSTFKTLAGTVKAALFQPVAITRAAIERTVRKDRFVTWAQICRGIQKLCGTYHIH